jgi:hypothetical protein
MKALLVTPASQSVELVEVASHDDIAVLIGFETIASDEIGPSGDRLFFDEECFLRGYAVSGRFQVDRVAPVAGKGIIVGSPDAGVSLRDAVTDVEGLLARITWL